jgi:phosphate transport system protein
MGRAVRQMLGDASAAAAAMDVGLGRQVIEADDAVDAAYLDLERTVVETIARQQPVAVDLRRLVASLQAGLHLERIADGAVDVARVVVKGMRPTATALDADTVAGLVALAAKVAASVEQALRAFEERSSDHCLGVAAMAAQVDDIYEDLIDRLTSATGSAGRAGALEVDRIARLLQRASGHAVDIAEAVWFQITGELREFDSDHQSEHQP